MKGKPSFRPHFYSVQWVADAFLRHGAGYVDAPSSRVFFINSDRDQPVPIVVSSELLRTFIVHLCLCDPIWAKLSREKQQ
jgi:hypothetical protein